MHWKSHHIFTERVRKSHDSAQSQQFLLIVIVSVKGTTILLLRSAELTILSVGAHFNSISPVGSMDGMQLCLCCNVITVTLETKYLVSKCFGNGRWKCVGLILISNRKWALRPWGHQEDMCPANSLHTVSVSCSNLGPDIPFCLSYFLCLYANSTCEHEQTTKSQGGKMGLSDSTPSLLSSLFFCLSLATPSHNSLGVRQLTEAVVMVTGPVCVPSLRHLGMLYFWEVERESKRNGERRNQYTCIGEMSLCELI